MRCCAALVVILLPSQCCGVELAASHPADGAKGVAVSAAIHLRFTEPMDAASLDGITLHVRGSGSGLTVQRATDLTQASVTLSPVEFLRPNTVYEVRGSAIARSRDARERLKPFKLTFRTSAESFKRTERLEFESLVFDVARSMTCVAMGPDGKLYAANAFGSIFRWQLDESGKPVNREVVLRDPSRSRQYIDLEWDPDVDSDRLRLWTSFSERIAPSDESRRFYTGTISLLEIHSDGVNERIVLTGLPHGREKQGGFDTLPHQPNGLVFANGKIYQSVGSTSSSGGPANWGIAEQKLSACVLEIDYQAIKETLDVHPTTDFDADAAQSPVRLFATGVRNALELVSHSNGRLYTAVNMNDRAGQQDGVPDSPWMSGNQNELIKGTTPNHESLLVLERGRHYGFPNPARGQFILNGGNPTDRVDPFEIPDYPVGTAPENGYAPELMFPIWRWGGTSPNGMLEYKPKHKHPLRGALLCCFYSAGDIAVMTLGSDGLPVRIEKLHGLGGTKLQFTGPLDITLDRRSGCLYVANFGTQSKFGSNGSMVMLRPVLGGRPQ